MKFSNIIYPHSSFEVIYLSVIRKPLRAFIIYVCIHYKRPHISRCLRNNAALNEKLPILAALLWFVTSYAVNPHKNLQKPLSLRNYSSLATFLSVTVKAMYIQSRIVSSESHNIHTSTKHTLRWIERSTFNWMLDSMDLSSFKFV